MSTQPAAFMAGPPSLPAGSHEMRDYYSNQDPPRPSPHTAPSITPYLGLRARLSQIWINRWTILLLLVLARILIAISGVNNDLASARREALSACTGVEAMGSAMASMPHYMSQGVNEMAASGVEKAVNGLMQMSILSITGVEEIVVFIIDAYTSTYECLITLAVSGSLHVAISNLEAASGTLNASTKSIGDEMSSTVSNFETAYNSFINDVNKVTLGLGGKSTAPTLDLSSEITKLASLSIPSDMNPALDKINASIPTFEGVRNFTNNLIRTPFELAKSEMQGVMGNYTFDRSLLPVPQKEQLTFCSNSNGINDFFDGLVKLAALARKIFIAVLLIAATLACIPMAYREIRRWRTQQERSRLVTSAAHDPMDVMYIVSRPYTSTAGIRVSNAFGSTRRQILTRWVIAYATSEAALFVLSLAVAGLLSCLCQYILLKSLEKEVPALTSEVGGFADQVVQSLNNASAHWALGTNKAIATTNQDINHNMLGWVNITTHALNDTLVGLVTETSDLLNKTFGGTILDGPIQGVFDCLVALKAQGIEKALTWISDNAQVELPGLANDTFTLGAVASLASNGSSPSDSFLSSSGTKASDDITAAVLRLTETLQNGIRTETIISSVLLGIWFLILFIGMARALLLFFGRDKTRGEGGTGDFHLDNNPQAFTHDIPQGAYQSSHNGPGTPAPKYSAATAAPEVHGTTARENGNPFDDDTYAEKNLGVGVAGQRDVTVTRGQRGFSTHPHVYGDSKMEI